VLATALSLLPRTLGLLPLKGPWSERMVRAARPELTLDEVEHTGERLEGQLEDQARAFLLRSPGKNRVETATRTVFASPILVWYRRYAEWAVAPRCGGLGLPFGDQALFCRRRDYAEAGGFPHEPLLEDVAFVLRRRRLGPLAGVPPVCLARLYNGSRPR
jgi:hypothetical protein